jgi:hypothetical protein
LRERDDASRIRRRGTVKSLAPSEVSALEKAGVTAVLPKEAGATQAAVSLITEALVTKVKNA